MRGDGDSRGDGEITKRCASEAASAWRSRSTIPGPGGTVRTARSASGAAALDRRDIHLLTRDADRLERIGKVVEIEDANPFQLRHPVEVVIIRHDGGTAGLCQLDELHIDLRNIGHVLVDKFDVDQRLLLQQVEDLEAATSTVAA